MSVLSTLSFILIVVIGTIQIKGLRLILQNQKETLWIKNKAFQLLSLLQTERQKKRRAQQNKDLVEKTVNDGAHAVEAVHKTIAGVTFDVLDALAARDKIKANTRKMRDIHDQTAGGVYRSVREVNKQLGSIADTLLNSGKKAQEKKL